MSTFAHDLGRWFWRLAPANPIMVRVVFAGGRRWSHFLLRLAYTIVLAGIVVFGVWAIGGSPSLGDMAKHATKVFSWVSHMQLGMVCVLAPIFTAAAITQERDSQTFNILLSTPLTNSQIVLGSLLSRLYFVFALLLAGIPLFCILMVYGGVTGEKIANTTAIAACTAAITGSMAIAISVAKIGTGRTIFTFYLAIAAYLIVVFMFSLWDPLIPLEAEPAPGKIDRMSWLAPFHPFLALRVVLGYTPAPELGAVNHYGFPVKYMLAYPHFSYVAMTSGLSALLVGGSVFFVRRGLKQGEPTFFNRLFGRERAAAACERTRKPRRVGNNPIKWRETATSAAAAGGPMTRYVIIILGALSAAGLLIAYGMNKFDAAQTRDWLFGLLSVEIALALFLATVTAATSMTREKETNTIELMLTTPVTSRKIILGKIWGLVVLISPLLVLPYATVALFVLFDLVTGRMMRAGAGPVVHWEALVSLPILFVAFAATACMLGLHCSIKCVRTLAAVFWSMSGVILVTVVLSGCAAAMSNTSAEVSAFAMPFSPFYAIYIAVNPDKALSGISSSSGPGLIYTCRIIALFSSIAAGVLYLVVGKLMHQAMVRGFDMTIRKQTT